MKRFKVSPWEQPFVYEIRAKDKDEACYRACQRHCAGMLENLYKEEAVEIPFICDCKKEGETHEGKCQICKSTVIVCDACQKQIDNDCDCFV